MDPAAAGAGVRDPPTLGDGGRDGQDPEEYAAALGFANGERQSHDAPFGHAGGRLHEWTFATRWGRQGFDQPRGIGGIDAAFSRLEEARWTRHLLQG